MPVSGGPRALPLATIPVLVYPQAGTDEHQTFHVLPGQTIAEVIGCRDLPAVIFADDGIVEPEDWTSFRVQRLVIIRRTPQGNVGRILGTLAIIALAVWAGPAAATALGYTAGSTAFAVASATVTAAVTVAGTLALNALIPPTLPGGGGADSPEQLQSITGVSNQARPFAPIPALYGNRTYYPPLPITALPYTELVGSDQYLRTMFVLGYGPLEIGGVTVGEGHSKITEATSLTGDPLKIGGTTIDQFEDVEFEIGTPSQMTLYANAVTEVGVNVDLNSPSPPTQHGETVSDGNSVIRTTELDVDEFSVELYSQALFGSSDDGDTNWLRVIFSVEYSPAGAGTWTVADSAWTISNRNRDPVRRGRRFRLPSRGQYDVRITRVSTFAERAAAVFSDVIWTVLRSIDTSPRPFDVDDTVVLAMRIRATDQLSGRIDRLSVNATRVVKVWNGSAWADAASRSPAWAYADILTGVATRTPKSLSEVDGDELLAWANWCDTNGLTFDVVFDSQGSVFDRARDAAAAGLAAWNITEAGKVSVVRDVAGQTPVALISPRVSSSFTMERRYKQPPHAFRVQFWDDVAQEPAERLVFDDGYTEANATRFEQLQTVGVVDPDQAWRIGRYHLAQARLRPETYRWNQDVQHLLLARGQLVEIGHDVILVGKSHGRIAEITATDGGGDATELRLDEQVSFDGGSSFALRIQKQDGSLVTAAIDTGPGPSNDVTLSSAVAGLNVGDHFTYGVSGTVTLLARITRLRPAGDLQAQVEAVPAAESIFDAWDGTIPSFNRVITDAIDQDLRTPPVPTLVDVLSGEEAGASIVDYLGGNWIAVTFRPSPGDFTTRVQARIRRIDNLNAIGSVATDWRASGDAFADSGVVQFFVEPGDQFEVQLRSFRNNRVSAWTSAVSHTFVGRTSADAGHENLLPAADVAAFESTDIGTEIKAWGGATGIPLTELGGVEGDTLRFAIELASDGDQQARPRLQFFDSGGSQIGSKAPPYDGDAIYRSRSVKDTIPALAFSVRPSVQGDPAATTGTNFFRRPMFHFGDRRIPFQTPPVRPDRSEESSLDALQLSNAAREASSTGEDTVLNPRLDDGSSGWELGVPSLVLGGNTPSVELDTTAADAFLGTNSFRTPQGESNQFDGTAMNARELDAAPGDGFLVRGRIMMKASAAGGTGAPFFALGVAQFDSNGDPVDGLSGADNFSVVEFHADDMALVQDEYALAQGVVAAPHPDVRSVRFVARATDTSSGGGTGDSHMDAFDMVPLGPPTQVAPNEGMVLNADFTLGAFGWEDLDTNEFQVLQEKADGESFYLFQSSINSSAAVRDMVSLRPFRVAEGATITIDIFYSYVHTSGPYDPFAVPAWFATFRDADGNSVGNSDTYKPASDLDRTPTAARDDAIYRSVTDTVPAGAVFAELRMRQYASPESSCSCWYMNARIS